MCFLDAGVLWAKCRGACSCHHLFDFALYYLLMLFGSLLASILMISYFLNYLFLHIFVLLVIDLGTSLVSFWMFFLWISCSCSDFAKSSKLFALLISLHVFLPFRKTLLFIMFLIFFGTSLGFDFDGYSNRFCFHFGTPLISISMCVAIVVWYFGG